MASILDSTCWTGWKTTAKGHRKLAETLQKLGPQTLTHGLTTTEGQPSTRCDKTFTSLNHSIGLQKEYYKQKSSKSWHIWIAPRPQLNNLFPTSRASALHMYEAGGWCKRPLRRHEQFSLSAKLVIYSIFMKYACLWILLRQPAAIFFLTNTFGNYRWWSVLVFILNRCKLSMFNHNRGYLGGGNLAKNT